LLTFDVVKKWIDVPVAQTGKVCPLGNACGQYKMLFLLNWLKTVLI